MLSAGGGEEGKGKKRNNLGVRRSLEGRKKAVDGRETERAKAPRATPASNININATSTSLQHPRNIRARTFVRVVAVLRRLAVGVVRVPAVLRAAPLVRQRLWVDVLVGEG